MRQKRRTDEIQDLGARGKNLEKIRERQRERECAVASSSHSCKKKKKKKRIEAQA